MTERRRERMLSVLRERQPDLTVVLENIHDPHNVSAILRTADAVGLLDVQLVYRDIPFPKLGKKSSASAVKWIARKHYRSMRECYSRLHEDGFHVYASRLDRTSASLFDLDLTEPVALVFGNEHCGVSAEAARLSDRTFRIPMAGMVESLNVSVACAVSLYEAFRQRKTANKHLAMDEQRVEMMFNVWMKK